MEFAEPPTKRSRCGGCGGVGLLAGLAGSDTRYARFDAATPKQIAEELAYLASRAEAAAEEEIEAAEEEAEAVAEEEQDEARRAQEIEEEQAAAEEENDEAAAEEENGFDAFDGLGWGDGFGYDEDGEPMHEGFVMFRNDVLPDTDTIAQRIHDLADTFVGDDGCVVRAGSGEDAFLISCVLVRKFVLSGRSVRHIIVHALPDDYSEWNATDIHHHGEGGKIITAATDHLPDRILNSRTLLIDERNDVGLQDRIRSAGGMVVRLDVFRGRE